MKRSLEGYPGGLYDLTGESFILNSSVGPALEKPVGELSVQIVPFSLYHLTAKQSTIICMWMNPELPAIA